MNLFTLISEKIVAMLPGEKVIKAKDFSSLLKASKILKTVKAEEKKYRIDVTEECEKIKENAYLDGFNEALDEFNEKLKILDDKINNIENELKKKLLPLAIKATKKIIGEELKIHPDRIVDIIIQALKPVIAHQSIKVYANKDDIEMIERNKQKIKDILENVKSFSIIERDDVEQGGCIIETEAGIINAGLENQLRALEKAFEKILKN